MSTVRAPDPASPPTVGRIALPTGVTLPCVDRGPADGAPVVLLHGVTDSWRSFEPLLPHLPGSIRAIVPSLRAHGDADRPEGSYRPADFAADVAALLDRLGIDEAVLAGHSMGSAVALRGGARPVRAGVRAVDAPQVTARRRRCSGRSHSRPSSTATSAATASQTSTKRVYSGVKPKRRTSGARKSPVTPRAIRACMMP